MTDENADLRKWLDDELSISSLIPATDHEFSQFKTDFDKYLALDSVIQCIATSRWKAKTDLIYKRLDC